jgi:PTH1 family peptidyl-tRNA hydrolase
MHATPFRIIVGLGNPGRDYAGTRHNVGFMIADRLAAGARAEFRAEKAWRAEVAKAGGTYYYKPQTYMNLSGESLRPFSDFYKISASEILVVFDDMALPLGKLRFRPSGSAGGHNGLRSIIEHFGTQDVPRLRFGIGGAEPGSAVGHVLGRFSPAERPLLEESLDRAVEAIHFAEAQGLATAMNAYN